MGHICRQRALVQRGEFGVQLSGPARNKASSQSTIRLPSRAHSPVMHRLHKIVLCLLTFMPTLLQAEFTYPMQAQQVAANIFAVITPTRELPNPANGGWNSNSAFIVTPQGVLLFDTGSSEGIGRALKATIASVTEQPVRWIVNSHAHGDHWLGNAVFADTVEHIYATSAVMRAIRIGGDSWVRNFNSMTGGITGASKILPPDSAIDEQTIFTLGGLNLMLFPSGDSHSPGDLMLWLPAQKVLIGGDVIYSDRMPTTGAGNLRQWINSLRKLQALAPRAVIPGHGSVTDVSGIQRLHALLDALWNAVEEGVDEGLSDFEMLPMVRDKLTDFKAHYPGLEAKLRRDLSHVFLQVEAASFE